MLVDYQDQKYFDDGDVFKKDWWVNHHVWATLAMLMDWQLKRPFRILDLGCGKGSLVYHLWLLKIDTWGCDISKYAVESTPFPDIRDRLFCVDIRKGLGRWIDACFGAVLCFDILEHIEEEKLDYVISEICRVTASQIFIRMPMIDGDIKPDRTEEHPSIFTRKEWVDMFRKYNFEEAAVDDILFRIQMVDPNNQVYVPFHTFDTLMLNRVDVASL